MYNETYKNINFTYGVKKMKKILLIDSNLDFQNRIALILKNNGFFVDFAATEENAVEILKNNKVDIIITKLTINNTNGEDFIKNIMEMTNGDIPVFLLANDETTTDIKKALSLGVSDFISRDISGTELIYILNKSILNKEKQKGLERLKYFVIDDSKFILETVKNYFNRLGIINAVYHTELNKDDSLEGFDCYIIDLVLKDSSGKQIISKIREKNREAVIIAISSVDNGKVIAETLKEGANDYIVKPFIEEVFSARLNINIKNYILLKEMTENSHKMALMSIVDGLTQVYNHKHIIERLDEELSEAYRYKKNISVLMMDIDYFKEINDNYGHQKGDEALKVVSKLLKKILREVDIIGRYGGEEFMAILPETNLENAKIAAERVRECIERDLEKEIGIYATMSIGVAEINEKRELVGEIINRADELLYKAKKNGRNRCEF